MFEEYITRWALVPDGEPIITHSSRLLPVRYENAPAMLKVSVGGEEKFGGGLMLWWDGDGAARILAHNDEALVLERATGPRSLAEMARNGEDDEATRILCRAVQRLHAPRNKPLPESVPLTRWFADLEPAAQQHGGFLAYSLEMANYLLSHPQDEVTLHGDIHHGNILDFGPRGWLAIDPKRLGGERGFDYANIFCNPDEDTAGAPEVLSRRATIIAKETGIDRKRLLQWVVAWTGLSAAWSLPDPMPDSTLAVGKTAWAELTRMSIV